MSSLMPPFESKDLPDARSTLARRVESSNFIIGQSLQSRNRATVLRNSDKRLPYFLNVRSHLFILTGQANFFIDRQAPRLLSAERRWSRFHWNSALF